MRLFSFNIKRELIISLFAFVFFLLTVPVVTYIYFASALESPEKIMNRNDTGILLLDRNNNPFFSFYSAKQRDPVHLSDIPKITQEAIIANEDKDFYHHPGFSLQSIIRAFFADITHKNTIYGASTITQQLVKNALLTPRRSFMRKYQEIILANEIERRYSKDKILEMYLNSAYFGDGSFGIEEAALRDFGVHANQLNLAQSSVLAGILSAPSQLSPISGDRSESLKRQKIVLSEMSNQKLITQEDMDKALSEKLSFEDGEVTMNTAAPQFALMVRDKLIKKYGEEEVARSGFKVKTTIDLKWQEIAQTEVEKQVENLRFNNVSNGAAVVEDAKTGEIRALVGSRDWNNPKFGKFNVAVAERQPGSSFKPIVYIKAMEDHLITPATVLNDSPITYNLHPGTYSPKDYDGKYRGPVTVRRALSNSLNIPAVQVINMLGVSKAVEMAKRVGLTTIGDSSNYGLSLVLGAAEVKPIELTNFYATLANYGKKNDPTLITEITDKNNEVIYRYSPKNEQIIEPQYAYLITSILSDNKARSEEFGNLLTINRTAAVKTGTTNDYKDSWTLGYTPDLAIGVWVGNNDNTPMDNIAGSLGAAPIWRDLMTEFMSGLPDEGFAMPPGVVEVSLCGQTASESARMEFFTQGTQPSKCVTPTSSIASQLTPGVSITPSTIVSRTQFPTSTTSSQNPTPANTPRAAIQVALPNGKEKH